MDALIRKKKQLLLVNKRLENKRSVRTALGPSEASMRAVASQRVAALCRCLNQVAPVKSSTSLMASMGWMWGSATPADDTQMLALGAFVLPCRTARRCHHAAPRVMR